MREPDEKDASRMKAGADEADDFIEKRNFQRVPLRVLQVRAESRKAFFFGYALNLSQGGLFIQTTNPKEPGTRVRLQIPLQRDLPPIECGAEVVWVQSFSSRSRNPPGMGLRFTELDEKSSARIEAFLKSVEARNR